MNYSSIKTASNSNLHQQRNALIARIAVTKKPAVLAGRQRLLNAIDAELTARNTPPPAPVKPSESWEEMRRRIYPSLMSAAQPNQVTARTGPNRSSSAASITYGYEK